ncbi:MAG: sulfatase-like hydrolase/transferase [Candidatus Hodarchaeota archaeon]
MNNIFLIVLDSARKDFIFNNIKDNFPELKTDFVDFNNCWSIYTSTFLSHYTIFFGDYINKSENENFPAQLKSLGYKSRSYCNYAVMLGYPFESEFKTSKKNHRIPTKEQMIKDLGIQPLKNWKRAKFGSYLKDYHGAADDENMNIPSEWENYIHTNKEKKNFMFLHFWKTHHNYEINRYLQNKIIGKNYREIGASLIKRIVKKELTEHFVRKIYSKQIYEVFNKYIKKMIKILQETGIYNDSLIIITSDHGEGLGDIGKYCNYGLYYLYNLTKRILNKIRTKISFIPDIRRFYCCRWDHVVFYHNGDYKLQKFIPLFIKFPGNEFGGRIYNHKVTLFDLINTINDLTDNKIDVRSNNGFSLYNLLKEGDIAREKQKIFRSIRKIKF